MNILPVRLRLSPIRLRVRMNVLTDPLFALRTQIERWPRVYMLCAACVPALLLSPQAAAQRSTGTDIETRLSVELLSDRSGAGVAAQKWGRLFSQLGYSARIRRGLSGEDPQISEKLTGSLRRVSLIGRLDALGRVHFPRRVFTTGDAKRLEQWLTELKTFGRQGAPEGKPLWGLNEVQFARVYDGLSTKLTVELEGSPLRRALTDIGLPEQFPLLWSDEAQAVLDARGDPAPAARQSLRGFSCATALAILLNDHGLAFHPLRTPSEHIELLITPLRRDRQSWPTGWELRESKLKTARVLFEFVPVDLDQVSFTDLLVVVADKTSIPILFDYHRLERSGIEPASLTVSIKPRRMTFYGLLQFATVRNRLSHRLLIDELGKPFVWISTAAAARERGISARE